MPKLWSEIEGEPWLDNPRRRRRAGKRRHGRKVGRRKSGLFTALANPRPRRRKGRKVSRHVARRFRGNPPSGGMGGSIMSRMFAGLKGGAGVVAGKAAVRAIPTMAGLPRTGPIGIGVQALTGVLLAPFVDRFFKGFGAPFLYGAFAAPMESLIVALNIPVIGPALSSYPDELSAIPATVTSLGGGMGAPPGFMIDDEEQALVQ